MNESPISAFGKIPCYLIDEATKDDYLASGFCPLSAKDNLEQHEREWRGVLDRLSQALSRHWKRGVVDGDFYLDSDLVHDRLLCVEVGDVRMLTPLLPNIVHGIVVETEPPYSVDICDSWGYLKTGSGKAFPHFNVFVEKDRFLVFSESLELLERLELHAIPLPAG
jgi:hypothetical protein